MTIFQLHQEKNEKKQLELPILELKEAPEEKKRDSLFSSVVTRFFFFLLLIADLIWGVYAVLLFTLSLAIGFVTLFRARSFKSLFSKAFLMVRRVAICALSLFVGFFSPAFGIMVACTYFLMYDKAGIEEVIPNSLQDQFKDIFKSNELS
ncbi:MAG TPA: hypothetical protein VLG76_06700 [Rhabdochlamydiaceae bacterium]|nr:hypothetical protein [Rhabdochlamydiaceae bacterium]